MKQRDPRSVEREKELNSLRWIGLAFFCLALVVVVLAVFAEPGTEGYRSGQSSLLTFILIVALLVPLRIRWWRVIHLHRHTRYEAQWGPYLFSGRFFLDLSIALAIGTVVFLLDLSFWPQHAIRLGAVSILAVVRVALGALFKKWKKS